MPNPTAILIAAGLWLSSCVGVFFWAQHIEANAWRVKVSEQKIEAGKVLATALQNNRVKENQDAENARKVDENHAKDLAAATASRDDFANRLRIARRGASCPNPGSTEAPDPGISPDPASISNDGPRGPDPALSLRDAALELQRYARACHSWALEVGR